MSKTRRNVLALATIISVAVLGLDAQQSKTPALRIVVIEGEGAVNIIQQKTAVVPLVEVRDRNDQPVSGAIVNFAIRNGRATFGGARTLSVTTNAAGRAAGASFAPSGTGALQIGATATFQGQSAAAVTIAQTNVMTAAEAAAVSSASASGAGGSGSGGSGGSAGAGSAGGGGLSATTLAIVGAAAAGGTLVATKVTGGDQPTTYQGTFVGPLPSFFGPACLVDIRQEGTVTLEIHVSDSGAVTGQGHVNATSLPAVPPLPLGCPSALALRTPEPHSSGDGPVSGTKSNLGFTASHPGNLGTNWRYDFSGAFSGAEIVGLYTLTVTSPGTPDSSARFPVTLR